MVRPAGRRIASGRSSPAWPPRSSLTRDVRCPRPRPATALPAPPTNVQYAQGMYFPRARSVRSSSAHGLTSPLQYSTRCSSNSVNRSPYPPPPHRRGTPRRISPCFGIMLTNPTSPTANLGARRLARTSRSQLPPQNYRLRPVRRARGCRAILWTPLLHGRTPDRCTPHRTPVCRSICECTHIPRGEKHTFTRPSVSDQHRRTSFPAASTGNALAHACTTCDMSRAQAQTKRQLASKTESPASDSPPLPSFPRT